MIEPMELDPALNPSPYGAEAEPPLDEAQAMLDESEEIAANLITDWKPSGLDEKAATVVETKELSDADKADLARENAKIRENVVAAGSGPHHFKPAEWTHPNGHPRCILCGAEERTDGMCMGDMVPTGEGARSPSRPKEAEGEVKYTESEDRDDRGRWTSGGGDATASVPDVNGHPIRQGMHVYDAATGERGTVFAVRPDTTGEGKHIALVHLPHYQNAASPTGVHTVFSRSLASTEHGIYKDMADFSKIRMAQAAAERDFMGQSEYAQRYAPDQERDDHGRFGSGGVAGITWAEAQGHEHAAETEDDHRDTFHLYDAERRAQDAVEEKFLGYGEHSHLSTAEVDRLRDLARDGTPFKTEDEAKAYARELVAKYAPAGTLVTLGVGKLDAAGITDLGSQPDTYHITIDPGYLNQRIICHEVAHAIGNEDSGYIGHGQSFREAELRVYKGEMPEYAAALQKALAEDAPPARTKAAGPQVVARVVAPDGKVVVCVGAPADVKGDVVGHGFHGNRWTGGIGGDSMPTTQKSGSLRPEIAARAAHVMEQLLQAEREGRATNMPPNEHDPRSPGRYSPERQAQHDAIINQILEENKDVPAERKAWIMGGLGGAGKTTLLSAGATGTANENNRITMPDGSKISAEELFGIRAGAGAGREGGSAPRLLNAINVNADDITERMAAAGMLPEVDHLAPMELSYLAHEEASSMSHELADRAIAEGKNMIWDVTLGSRNSGAERIAQLKEQGYHVTGVFVDVSVDHSIAAALDRYQRGVDDYTRGEGYGGRYVPPSLIEQGRDGADAYSKNRLAFDALVRENKFDKAIIINNEDRQRRVEKVA